MPRGFFDDPSIVALFSVARRGFIVQTQSVEIMKWLNRILGVNLGMVGGLVVSLALSGCPSPGREVVLLSFDRGSLPAPMQQNNVEARIVTRNGRRTMEVKFHQVDWPNVFFTPTGGTWDWGDYAGVVVDIFNPEEEPADVCIRVDNEGADGQNHCNTGSASIPAGRRGTLQVRFSTSAREVFWGMRGVPVRGPVGQGATIDPSRMVAWQVFLPRPQKSRTLLIEEARLFGKGSSLAELVPLPFVDRFGQYMHADWPGKLKSENDFAKRKRAEARGLARGGAFPGRDKFGGWADGLQLRATGWFRTEQVNGKWWLVTPEGHLFFSNGMDCVGTWEQTFITGRDGWFAWLPDANDPNYKDLFGEVSGAHSMADRIGGKGRTFSFYRSNLIRKYGNNWPGKWRESVYPRLRSWGFNTIANWSQDDVLENSPMPFVGSIGIWGEIREIEGARGYWGRMRDVFDPSFAQAADASMAAVAKKYSRNPLCIGYFVDNEMSWETVREGTLASPPDQPCRVALVEQLAAKYGSIEKLNEAWGADAPDWDSLRVPPKANAACGADLDAFVYQFARRYFETVNDAIKRYAPYQLYLGCRFATAPPIVVRACADVVDVVSYNLYYRSVPCDPWTDANDLGKPIVIGEFHFGALDRGMFHPGLVPTEDQKDRAAHYIKYVRSVADCPAFVGCHWFQYIDEPITGRWFDGENYNIGFLDVTDTPYPEMVAAAKKVHAEIYARRYGAAK
jgi:hypothetical protein